MASKSGCSRGGSGGFVSDRLLKRDLFGQVERGHFSRNGDKIQVVQRRVDLSPWITRPIAKLLLARELRALRALEGLEQVPQLVASGPSFLVRTWLDRRPMQEGGAHEIAYHDQARRLLSKVHRRGVAHNDSAKEPNWLVLEDETPALIDFQLASYKPKRTIMWRIAAREDLRHLLKHKRTYCPDHLSSRESLILNTPAWPSRMWKSTGKRVYMWITRRVLKWEDREGAGDRPFGH